MANKQKSKKLSIIDLNESLSYSLFGINTTNTTLLPHEMIEENAACLVVVKPLTVTSDMIEHFRLKFLKEISFVTLQWVIRRIAMGFIHPKGALNNFPSQHLFTLDSRAIKEFEKISDILEKKYKHTKSIKGYLVTDTKKFYFMSELFAKSKFLVKEKHFTNTD